MELKVTQLTKQYGPKTAVDHLDITLSNGVYGLLGANGAGKTTLMRLLCNIQTPTFGKITLDRKDISVLGERYRNLLGYLPQHFRYYPEFTAWDFLMYVATLKGLSEKQAKNKTSELLEAVDLSKEGHRKIKTFWRVVNKKGYKNKNYTLDSVNQYFKKIEETSTHPYIYAQKARILLPLLRFKKENREKIKECLKDSFEKTIISVETQYINIKGTISYASILRELGKFYLEDSGNVDYNKAANYSEKAKVIYEKIDKGNRYYYFTIRNLAKAYIGLYGKTQEKAYVSEALKLWNQIQKYEGNDLEALKKEAQESMDYCIDLL